MRGRGLQLLQRGLGFTYVGLNLAANDGVPGGPDGVTTTLTVTAGPVEQTCANTVETSDPDSPALTSSDTVDITAVATCDLMQGDLTFPSVAPTRGSLYSALCLNAEMRLAVPNTPSVAPGDVGDLYTDLPGTLRLYQMECERTQGIHLLKNRVTGRVAVQLF